MARRRNKTRRNSYTARKTRRYYTTPKRTRLRSFAYSNQYSKYNDSFVEARRTRTPTYTNIRRVRRNQSRQVFYATKVLTNRKTAPLPSSPFREKIPFKQRICVQRQQRKEVLHAKRHTGKGGQRPPKNNKFRNIICR